MDTLTNNALLMFSAQVAELVNKYGEVVLQHGDNDVEHHVVPGAKGWLVTTRSRLGVLHQVEYTSIESLALDLVGTQIHVPAARHRYATG